MLALVKPQRNLVQIMPASAGPTSVTCMCIPVTHRTQHGEWVQGLLQMTPTGLQKGGKYRCRLTTLRGIVRESCSLPVRWILRWFTDHAEGLARCAHVQYASRGSEAISLWQKCLFNTCCQSSKTSCFPVFRSALCRTFGGLYCSI